MTPIVLRIATRLNVGGPARHIATLTRATAASHPAVVAAGRPPPEEGELWPVDLPLTRLPLVRAPSPVRDVRALAATRRLIRRLQPAIVETHMAKAGTVGRMASASVRPRPRTVHVFHGHVLEGYFRPSVERGVLAAERRLARSTDILIAVSDEIRDDLLDRGIGVPRQWRVVPLGLALDPYLAVADPHASGHGSLRQELGLAPDTPLVGAVGRLAAIKDLDTLLAAVAALPGVHVAVVGDGPESGRLRRLASASGLEGRAHFLGLRSDVADVLGNLDVVVLTSRNEGTPVALIEALAAARPVVATRVGGVPAVVQDGVTGTLVEAGDVVGVAEAVRWVLDHPSTAADRARAGRRDVQGRFGTQRMASAMAGIYDELLGGRDERSSAGIGRR